ncbi:hypothetical protein Hanom_Chr11g00980581 [Helianthus anomalus]
MYLGLTDEQKRFFDCEEKAMSMITMAMPQSILHTFRKRNSSKELWDSMIERYEGNAIYKKRRLEKLKTQFVVFKALKNESFDDTVNRFYHLLSELDRSQENIYTEFEKVEKFLNCLSREWNMYTALIREGVLEFAGTLCYRFIGELLWPTSLDAIFLGHALITLYALPVSVILLYQYKSLNFGQCHPLIWRALN